MATDNFQVEEVDLFDEKFIKISPGNWILPQSYLTEFRKYRNIDVRPDDIWLISYPKTGTTWSCEMVWCILNRHNIQQGNKVPQFTRWCFPEYDALKLRDFQHLKESKKSLTQKQKVEMTKSSLQQTLNQPSPRLIKTHLPLALLPPNLLHTCKVFYICRNPLDTAVSFYHYGKDLSSTKVNPDFHTYLQLFLEDLVPFAPFCNHVKEAWEQRYHPNMFFFTYEQMQQNLAAVLRSASSFLDVDELSDANVNDISSYLSFNSMKQNKMVNWDIQKEIGMFKEQGKFLRKGVVGDWKTHFTTEEETQLVEWWQNNMAATGLAFPGVDILNRIHLPLSKL